VQSVAAVVLSSILVAATVREAPETWMSAGELEQAFAGKTITGRYASGKPFSETYRADHGLEYREKGVLFGGRWSIEAGTFCTIYDRDQSGGCFRVARVARNCYEFYFVARTEADAARRPKQPHWTARGSVEGEGAACAEELAV
jgi:hypothetical protein